MNQASLHQWGLLGIHAAISWTNINQFSCQIWCVRVFHHVLLKYGHENAEMQKKKENLMTSHFTTLLAAVYCILEVLLAVQVYCLLERVSYAKVMLSCCHEVAILNCWVSNFGLTKHSKDHCEFLSWLLINTVLSGSVRQMLSLSVAITFVAARAFKCPSH